MADARYFNEKGRFKEGNPGGPGRPPKAREAALLLIAQEVCNSDTWRQIFTRQVLDALGKKRVTGQEGRTALIDDPDSTAASRARAYANVRDTIIGKPTEFVRVNDDSDPYQQFAAYSDAELETILAFIEQIQRDGSSRECNTGGTKETSEGTPGPDAGI